MSASVIAVALNSLHSFSKLIQPSIRLLAGLGVEGDAHCGRTVKHRSRVAQDPTQANLRQVHLLHSELFDALAHAGFRVNPADIGENITTVGIDLLALPEGCVLELGESAAVKLTGLRNPCYQLDHFQPGLMSAVLDRKLDGSLIRKSGVMAVVLSSGTVTPGDGIVIHLPDSPSKPLERV
jgi:MOSC domain-containing protein YiiM